ncbi:pantetheine-phosphate adenylyltransferase [Nakamurella leprariae]|uniref:Phosphopantetheine adenylyltransferase n=1 Tax=Nakamurella leprariae TaxID=2803911 RepID=A0A939C3L6_9ACTN|nr:pantetheine-phosphate adenylyltransferase [Nakamurella leprariae]MBM9469554.1 pantetheine-phosphate adenylyltransferase [Nakamurella leprariae]
MTHAVCPGSFDPPTLGHLDVIGRAAGLFDRVTVAVLVNPDKAGLFAIPERLELLRTTTQQWPNVEVDSFRGLLVDYCREREIGAIVKGLRAVSDFDYELQMAQMNHGMTGVDTLFLPTSPEFSFISSSLVKQIATYGGDVAKLLAQPVSEALTAKLADRSGA